MVRSSLPALALLALSASAATVPAANPPAAPFSMMQWIEGIIADPTGDNLTPEEAVAAWNATRASAGSLAKRVNCWDGVNYYRRANVRLLSPPPGGNEMVRNELIFSLGQ